MQIPVGAAQDESNMRCWLYFFFLQDGGGDHGLHNGCLPCPCIFLGSRNRERRRVNSEEQDEVGNTCQIKIEPENFPSPQVTKNNHNFNKRLMYPTAPFDPVNGILLWTSLGSVIMKEKTGISSFLWELWNLIRKLSFKVYKTNADERIDKKKWNEF